MTYPPYLREKARSLRKDGQFSIDEIGERLALPRTTVYYWVRDLPLDRARRMPRSNWPHSARAKGNRAMKAKYTRLREAAYRQGEHGFDALAEDPSFRDFVLLFMTEGYRRNRNLISIANSDPTMIELAASWMRFLSSRKLFYSLQFHADQDLRMLRGFWENRLRIDPEAIRLLQKSNSGQLASRTWRCQFGVMTVGVHDTYLRARMQAWMDCVKRQWLDSARAGV